MTIQAPAKVNLVLRILGKRPDGFHEIETLMVPVTLADTIHVERAASGIFLTCSDPGVPADATNLAHRAAAALAAHVGRDLPVRLHLEKRTPSGAGLGGGSSDAAAVLVGLTSFFELGLTAAELEKIAATLGSDIPFFIKNVPAWCRGRGEILEPAAGVPAHRLLLVKPPFPVPTAWAYREWAALQPPPATPDALGLVNDLEKPVFSKYLLLPALKSWLAAQPGVAASLMSGSGSTIFAVLSPEAPTDLVDRVRAEFGSGFFVCETETSPVRG